MNIAIDIACNDPDNGLFAGRAAAIQLPVTGDTLMELAASDMAGPRMREEDGHIVISNRKWPIVASKDWVGNWVWNRYWMELDVAVAFIAWVHSRRRFSVEQAEERLYNAWQSHLRFPVGVLHALLTKGAA